MVREDQVRPMESYVVDAGRCFRCGDDLRLEGYDVVCRRCNVKVGRVEPSEESVVRLIWQLLGESPERQGARWRAPKALYQDGPGGPTPFQMAAGWLMKWLDTRKMDPLQAAFLEAGDVVRLWVCESEFTRFRERYKGDFEVEANAEALRAGIQGVLWGAAVRVHASIPPEQFLLVTSGDGDEDLRRGWMPRSAKLGRY